MEIKYDVVICNFFPQKNMGGVLNAWAYQKTCERLGQINILMNYQVPTWKMYYSNSFVERFQKKHLNVTESIYEASMLSSLNDMTNIFILGSDCIWGKWSPNMSFRNTYIGNFIASNKKIISYAPSFGNAFFDGNNNEKICAKYFLNRIDALSVREKSGVDILKNDFNLESTQVLDPTLLLNKEEYDELIKNSKCDKQNYIFNYSIGVKEDDTAYVRIIEILKDENIFSLQQSEFEETDVEDWLYLIKNTKLWTDDNIYYLKILLKNTT